jgi:PAS domain S-box-containing protein
MKSITIKLLISIGGLTICFLALILYSSYSLTNKQINEVIEQQASMALKFNLAIRGYVGGSIRPIMYQLIEEDEFIVEAMSTSYVARSIFEEVRKKFPEYIIKFSSDNPRNPINQAGPEELKIIEHFNNNPDLNRWEGVITIKDKKYMAKFNARRMKKSCLYCHGNPKDAPASMIEKYGSVAGFNRKIGKVIGMDTVAIPINKITEKLWHELKTTFPIFAIGLLLFFCAVFIVIKLLVINRLIVISKHFRSAAEETDYSQIGQIDIQGKDEIFDLASGYNTLTDKLKGFYSSLNHQVKQRTQSLEKVNEKLLQEINEKNEAEKALRESQTRFKALHNASFGGIAIHDKGIILDCNQGLSKMTGYSEAELVGMDGLLLIAKESRDLVMGNIVSNYEKAYEAIGLRRNGEEYPIRIEARNVPYKGKQVRTVEIRDITENKQAEKEHEKLQVKLIQAQKMRAIGTLAGGIAHDFNNILSGILGYSQLAQIHLKNPEKANEHIEQILKGAQRAADLTKQILTFSRQSEYQKQPFKIYLEIKEALKLLRSSIPSTIEIESKLDSKKMVLADPIEIHQVIMNLCTNAYHAMRRTGGHLTVSLSDFEISDSKIFKGKKMAVGEYIKLEVSDTGHGMDTKTVERAFEPYFTTKEKGDGTGLGLALVQAIVEEHDGFCEVKSEPAKGTSVYLYFPIARENEEKNIPKIKKESPLTGNEKIMVVDDEEPIRKIHKVLLENYGYQVQTFGNGVEALETFKTNPDKFDLIITDMTMPGFAGDKLATEILKIKPGMPIVLCTGFSENISRAEAIELGIKQFVQKPILNQDLVVIIRRILDENDDTMPIEK